MNNKINISVDDLIKKFRRRVELLWDLVLSKKETDKIVVDNIYEELRDRRQFIKSIDIVYRQNAIEYWLTFLYTQKIKYFFNCKVRKYITELIKDGEFLYKAKFGKKFEYDFSTHHTLTKYFNFMEWVNKLIHGNFTLLLKDNMKLKWFIVIIINLLLPAIAILIPLVLYMYLKHLTFSNIDLNIWVTLIFGYYAILIPLLFATSISKWINNYIDQNSEKDFANYFLRLCRKVYKF